MTLDRSAVETKIFEIRDEGTHCTALCVRLDPTVPSIETPHIRHAGWRTQPGIVVVSIRGGVQEAHHDAFDWCNIRTWRTAHQWIEESWDELASGSVIDVRVILGESAQTCASEVLGLAPEIEVL